MPTGIGTLPDQTIWNDSTPAHRDQEHPQLTDHCFTGDYPTLLTDRSGEQKTQQLSLLAETA